MAPKQIGSKVQKPKSQRFLDYFWPIINPCSRDLHRLSSLPETEVSATKAEAERMEWRVPATLAEYCIKTKVPSNDNSSDLLYDDLCSDDIDDEDEEEDADCSMLMILEMRSRDVLLQGPSTAPAVSGQRGGEQVGT